MQLQTRKVIHAIPVVGVLDTAFRFFIHPLTFSAEVALSDRKDKVGPIRFLAECCALALASSILENLNQYGASLSGYHPAQVITAASGTVSIATAFFLLNVLVHFCVAPGRLSAAIGFNLFCYLQGAVQLSTALIGLFAQFVVQESFPEIFVAAWSLYAAIGVSVFYSLLAIHSAYRLTSYLLAMVAVCCALVFGIVSLGLGLLGNALFRLAVDDLEEQKVNQQQLTLEEGFKPETGLSRSAHRPKCEADTPCRESASMTED